MLAYKMAIEKSLNCTIHQDGPQGLISWSVEYLVTEFFVSPIEIIKAATRNDADCCGVLKDRGTLETGKYADLISVRGNPLNNIKDINEIDIVMVGGNFFDPLIGH